MDTGKLYDHRDKRELEVDFRTGKLRWCKDDEVVRMGTVSVEDALLKLYEALAVNGEPSTKNLPHIITGLFRKMDDDNSGVGQLPAHPSSLFLPSKLNPKP